VGVSVSVGVKVGVYVCEDVAVKDCVAEDVTLGVCDADSVCEYVSVAVAELYGHESIHWTIPKPLTLITLFASPGCWAECIL
jgi:hypothetical protein